MIHGPLKQLVWKGVVEGLETEVFIGGIVGPGDAPQAFVEVPSYPLAATPAFVRSALAAALHAWAIERPGRGPR